MITPDSVAKTRKSVGMTQQALAKRAGVSQSLIAKLERGLLKPSFDVMLRIDAALKELQSGGHTAADFIRNIPVLCAPNEAIEEVIAMMNRRQFSQLPVIRGGVVIGMVTERDLLRGVVQQQKRVKDVMSPPPPIVAAETREEVLYALLDHVNLLLVMHEGKLSGVITKNDVFRVLRKK